MLYFLVTAMYPRFLITLDENLKPLPVSVRVGQVCEASIFLTTGVSGMALIISAGR